MEISLLNIVEPLRRGRGDFLYTYRGNRLVDLWKQGGMAILGHGKSHQLTCLKDTLARGVWMPAPHPGMHHLEKAIKKLFPGKEIRIYRGLHRALYQIGLVIGKLLRWEDIPDPAYPGSKPEWGELHRQVSLWRPWVRTEEALNPVPDILLPLLPIPWPEEVAVLILSESAASQFPPSELLSPVFAEYAQRAVYDLLKSLEQAPKVMLPKTCTALAGSSIWNGSGLYWYINRSFSLPRYEGLFKQFLQEGFLLPPVLDDPLILPWTLSSGLDAKLAKLLSFPAEA